MEEQQHDERRIRRLLEQRLYPGILLSVDLLLYESQICSAQGMELQALDLSTTARVRVEGDWRNGQGMLYVTDIKPTKGYRIEGIDLQICKGVVLKAIRTAINACQVQLQSHNENIYNYIIRLVKKPFEG